MTFVNTANITPKFSIVIPVWGKYLDFLEQAIKTASEQTYSNYEIIVVKDKKTLPSARNEGIRRAKGEYILPLDVDDKIDKTYLEKCVKVLEEYDVAYSDVREFGEHWQDCQIPEHFTLKELLENNKLVACSAFKKKDWEEIGGYDENLVDGYEDWDFWIRMMAAGKKFKKINETLFFYNKHGKSMSSEFQENDFKQREYINQKYENLRRDASLYSN